MNAMNNNTQLKRIGGSPGNALSNNFKINSNEVLQEAWELTKTTKPPFLLGALIIYFIALASSFILEPLQPEITSIEELETIPWILVFSQLTMQIVVAVLLAGLIS